MIREVFWIQANKLKFQQFRIHLFISKIIRDW